MNVIPLPSWSEILAPGAPWALLLRSGAAGVWLLRGAAEEEGVDARVVAGTACRTSADALGEWAAALELGEAAPPSWDALADRVAAEPSIRGRACGVLVADAEWLLETEPARLPMLLDALRSGSERLQTQGTTLRFVLQSRFEALPDRLAVFREFDVADIR